VDYNVYFVLIRASHVLPPAVPTDIPPYVIRVLLIYGRSHCEPTVDITKVGQL